MADPKDYHHFKAEELQCKCTYPICPRHGMDDHFMEKLEELRRQLGFPLIISSAYRCPNHNNDVSTTGTTGPHTMGQAADIRINGTDARKLVEVAIIIGMDGIGIQQAGARGRRFVHVDMMKRQGGQVIWSY